MSCGVGHRCSLDLKLLWLWCRLEATAPIQPLAWEAPYSAGVALKRQKNKNKNKKLPPQPFLNGRVYGIKHIPITIHHHNSLYLVPSKQVPMVPSPQPLAILLSISMNLTTLVKLYCICLLVTGIFPLE